MESLQKKTSAQSVITHGPLFRHGPKIFCVASHTVGYNKRCGMYLIFHLDLNYIMGSQRPWTVFELLDFLSAVIIKELELLRVRLDIFMHQLSFQCIYVHN